MWVGTGQAGGRVGGDGGGGGGWRSRSREGV